MATDLGNVNIGDSPLLSIGAGGDDGGGGSRPFGSMIPVYGGEGGRAPWTYRGGKWTNAYVQIGDCVVGTGEYSASNGANYVHVHIGAAPSEDSISVGTAPTSTSSISFYVGTVSGGRQTSGIYAMPIVLVWS